MKPIHVTKTFLPPFDEFTALLKTCWENHCLTNNGPLLNQFESQLREILKNPNSLCVSNGTIALQFAIRALNLKGKVITTPFSYVATTSSILWEHCQPVFADVSPLDLNIDPNKIEECIDDQTVAILAVHVYGNPCEVEKIQAIADRHGLKVIYDAAHAFGVEYKGKPISDYGDITTFSLHATKLIHSVEGGVISCHSKKIFQQLSQLRAFGHTNDEHHTLGINGKLSELHAAMGICVLNYFNKILESRKQIFEIYSKEIPSLQLETLQPRGDTKLNYSYYPILFSTNQQRDEVHLKLQELSIFTRKYFMPSLNKLPYVEYKSCPISESASDRVLCLPLSAELKHHEAQYVTESLRDIMRAM